MGIFRTTGKAIGLMFNLRADKWIDYKNLKKTSFELLSISKKIFQVQHAKTKESFSASLHRLNITEQNLATTQKQFYYFMLFYLMVSVIISFYGLYILFSGHVFSY